MPAKFSLLFWFLAAITGLCTVFSDDYYASLYGFIALFSFLFLFCCVLAALVEMDKKDEL
ncbi:MAG: hypothetical protein LAT61_12525 [Alcanivorax sp.]|nr:hypothetical protein [Alcanivorax sp.]